MSTLPFVHLHCHSHYSLLDGASTIFGLLRRTKDLGMNSLALTDHGNLHGVVAFYTMAKEMGIHPVLGMEGYIAPGSRFDKDSVCDWQEAAHHITLLAQNRTGFQNLLRLSSIAFLEGFHHYPRLDKKMLAEHSGGVICLSGCLRGELNRNLLADDLAAMSKARETAAWYAKVFGDRYFIEIQYNGIEIQRIAMEKALDLAHSMGLPVVATSDVHYVFREDAEAQDILLCLSDGKPCAEKNRMRRLSNEFHLRSPNEMAVAFPGQEDALKRTQEIAERCDLELDFGKHHFPVYVPPENRSPAGYLRDLCVAGLKDRYANEPNRLTDGDFSVEVQSRLDHELSMINKMGIANYFLIVWNMVRFARSQGIPTTGRGSCAGSLVAYALYLSHVCPLTYGLLFERFLDENSDKVPDIDIDFCQQRRGEVIQYVKQNYGAGNVAQIGTFGTLACIAAIRDVGWVLGIPESRVDDLVAMIPAELGITIRVALENNEDLKRLYETDPEVQKLLRLAMKIEGLVRNVGTHAAAIAIADRPLMDYVPLLKFPQSGEIVTQWSMGDIEKVGLLKMDVLGLRSLTVLSQVVASIEQRLGERLDPYRFPLDDTETFALICRGDTTGVCQLESDGIRALLPRIKPENFRDIMALNALYRPGPLGAGLVEHYIQAKTSRKVAHYEHVVIDEILAETYGVMVYQEQVMQILHRLGDIALADAYSCVKAMGKNKHEVLATFRREFIEGASHKDMTTVQAEETFGRIARTAGYTFNKAHSAAYALIAYQTAYLKAHYPSEFASCVG